MAKFEPNEEQKMFLTSKDCNVLVSASAGSGKTSTMIQKLVRIMSDERMPVTSLLVVTYTNAAASEIKLKLYNEILKLITESEDKELQSFLKDQLDNISNAEIGTLHAICRKLIVKYFYEIEESPDFGLLLEKEQKYLLDNALKNVFSNYITSNDEAFFELYDCYNSKRNDATLKKMVLNLYNFKNAKVEYSAWRENFLRNSYNCNLNENYACSYLVEHGRKVLLLLSRDLLKLKSRVSEFPRYADFINSRSQFIDEFVSASNNETAIKVLTKASFLNKPRCLKTDSVDVLAFDEEVSVFSSDFSACLKSMKEDFVSTEIQEISENIAKAKINTSKLLEVVDKLEQTYTSLKKRKNVLDFNDLEDKMLQLLQSENICNSLKSQYKYIFVDEYQDINDKQENILLKLTNGNNYYMIGDVKQSIYAFRLSSPKIFISKYNDFSQDGINSKVISFNKNYRSDKNILEFANSVFDNIITSGTIGIDYKRDARFESCKDYKNCCVSLNIINDNDEIENAQDYEAKLIASEILRFVQTKKENGDNYSYGDIAIILRKRGEFVKNLVEVLTDLQIPVKTTISSDFFGTSEVQLLVSILKVISSFKDDVALVTVLKNLFEINEEELMEIKISTNRERFYECVTSFDGSEDIKQKIAKLFDFVEYSRKQLLVMTIRDYLNQVINNFDIVSKIRCSPDGEKRVSNIIEFLKIADNENYQYGLDKFLEYLEFISKENSLQNIGSDYNAVEICTIHHSKGLEYPAVILAGLGSKFQLNKDSSEIIVNNDFGVGLKSINSKDRSLSETIVRNACKLSNIKSEINEEIRLLYVAMTRAKEQLSLIGVYNLDNMATAQRKQIYSLRNYWDMIFRSIDNVYISAFQNKSEFVINEGELREARVKIYSKEDFDEKETKQDIPINFANKNMQLVSGLSKIHSDLPNSKTTTIKNTVTNILKEEVDYENLNFIPKKLDVSDKVPNRDFLRIGTAYHAVMQEISFTESKEELEILISNMVAENKIESELKRFIRIDDIFNAIMTIAPIIKGARNVYREKQFLMCENYNKLVKTTDNNTKVIVQGVIDLIVERDDGVYLIDYKTNRGCSPQELVNEYALQIELYSKAYYEATGTQVNKKYLYSFALNSLIELE